MNTLQLKEAKVLDVQFVGDDDVLNHIFDREGGTKIKKEKAQLLVNPQKIIKKPERELEKSDQEVLKDQNYVEVLGRNIQESLKNGSSVDGGNKVYSFQHRKHSEEMTKLGMLLFFPGDWTPMANFSSIHQVSDCFYSSPVPTSHCDSESEYSASDSEDEEEEDTNELGLSQKSRVQSRGFAAPVSKGTPAKKMKRDKTVSEGALVSISSNNFFSLFLKKTLRNLLSKFSPSFSAEIAQLNQQHEKLFHKWMLQLRLGFNIVLYGLGSKRDLLEKFRTTMLQESIHVVINGFFPGISVKSILNSITEEVLNHTGTFQSVLDQRDWIINKFKEDSSLELFLLIHNLDSQMLRGDTSQQVLGQLSSLENVYLLASIDHLNAPLMWDHAKQSLYNWLWYETTTYNPYSEETSYENSLLVKQSGSLPLSSLIHVLRSLTPNARGIFRLLIKFQLDNQDSPSYIGLSFQDFYQQCREAFLVNSDLTLRAQLTEFRDHKLIRTKKGTDGVEYLLIPIDSGTLADFLEKEEEEA
uniref:Origin recognition complex subunit 2 n=1 Tax=Peromyscus maniculatus bairdii TaxID=230844 RepID=A0A8C8TC07_PERMB